jgi:hypothetical protein
MKNEYSESWTDRKMTVEGEGSRTVVFVPEEGRVCGQGWERGQRTAEGWMSERGGGQKLEGRTQKWMTEN